MSIRKYVFTSSLHVPVYGSWRCEHCGETNFSEGIIECERRILDYGSRELEAKNIATRIIAEEWRNEAYSIIKDPKSNAQLMHSCLKLNHTCCSKCGHKARWDRSKSAGLFKKSGIIGNISTLSLLFSIAVSSGLVAFVAKSFFAFLVFISSLILAVVAVTSESRYKKLMQELLPQFTPVLGSLDRTLVEHAARFGKKIPTPKQTIEIVKSFCPNSEAQLQKSNEDHSPILPNNQKGLEALDFADFKNLEGVNYIKIVNALEKMRKDGVITSEEYYKKLEELRAENK